MSFAVDRDSPELKPGYAPVLEVDDSRVGPANARPNPGERPRVFNLGYWGEGAVTAREAQLTFVRHLADRLPDLEGRRVLDLSHRAGGSSAVLALEYGAQVDAVNVPPEEADGARAYAAAHGVEQGLRFHAADPTELPFGAGTFDVVFSLEAAHHVSDKRGFVREAHRTLRPGGMIVLSDMTATVDLPVARRLRSRGVDLMTAHAWRDMAEEAGFEIIEHRLVGSAVYPGHRRWMMLTAAERRRVIGASLTRGPTPVPAPMKQARAWWLEFFGHRSGVTFADVLGLREYVVMLGRRPIT